MNTEGSTLCNSACFLATGQAGAASTQQLAACTAYCSIMLTLAAVWHYAALRPGQLEAVLLILHGRDAFVRMATGAGKSLCIFLAPLAGRSDGMAVVISPLNGLMDEQVCMS